LGQRDAEPRAFLRYFIFAEDELLFLIVCVVLDVSEYIVAILLLPRVGDFLDIVGIIACLVMFRWVGIMSFLELIPGADIFPIFIITWLVWYLLKKQREKEKRESQKKRSL
jgi:hypothetical protein